MALLLGFDWADEKHDVCVMTEAGAVLDAFTFPHQREGLEEMKARVEQRRPEGAEVFCALETSHGLLVSFLLEAGWTVYAINPKSVERYRERTRTARVKSDQLDAWMLADLLRTDRDLHRPLRPDSVEVEELRALTRDREALVQESVRLGNQLLATLKAYWPEVLGLIPDLRCPWALDFLLAFPTHEKACRVSRAKLEQFLKDHRYPNRAAKAEQIYAALRQPHLPVPDHVVRAKHRQMLHWARQLKTTRQDLRAYDREIERLLKEHPDGQLFLSLPGAASNLAARLLAEIGDTRDRYATANNLQCEAGTAPVIRQSGKILHVVRVRRACKKPLRQALQLFAGCSLTKCAWARELYDKHRAQGKRHAEAVRIVANKWVKIIFAMWKTNTLYDETRFLAARERYTARSSAA